eukprot:gene4326-4899_t
MSTRQGTVYGPLGEDVGASLLVTSHQSSISGHQRSTLNLSHIEEDQASMSSRKSSQASSSSRSGKSKSTICKEKSRAEKEAAVASAEERVYEAAELEVSERINIDVTPTNVMDRTRDFITTHFSEKDHKHPKDPPVTSFSTQSTAPHPTGFSVQAGSSPEFMSPLTHFSQSQTLPVVQQPVHHQTFYSAPPIRSEHPLRNQVSSFQQPGISHSQPVPTVYQPMPTIYQPVQTQQPDPIMSLTKHLMKKELISTGLLKFDDNPANFRAWKASFKAATEDLELTEAQEINLVVKWLGEKSLKIVNPVCTINIENPQLGLKRVWETLEKRYGTAEVLEDNFMSRLESFPNQL